MRLLRLVLGLVVLAGSTALADEEPIESARQLVERALNERRLQFPHGRIERTSKATGDSSWVIKLTSEFAPGHYRHHIDTGQNYLFTPDREIIFSHVANDQTVITDEDRRAKDLMRRDSRLTDFHMAGILHPWYVAKQKGEGEFTVGFAHRVDLEFVGQGTMNNEPVAVIALTCDGREVVLWLGRETLRLYRSKSDVYYKSDTLHVFYEDDNKTLIPNLIRRRVTKANGSGFVLDMTFDEVCPDPLPEERFELPPEAVPDKNSAIRKDSIDFPTNVPRRIGRMQLDVF